MDINHASAVGFADYYRIRRKVELKGDLPHEEITQHNSDKVTYDEAYLLLSDLMSEQSKFTQECVSITMDSIGEIVATLVGKGVLNMKDAGYIQQRITELAKEKSEGDN